MLCYSCDKEFNEYEEAIHFEGAFYCHECAYRELFNDEFKDGGFEFED